MAQDMKDALGYLAGIVGQGRQTRPPSGAVPSNMALPVALSVDALFDLTGKVAVITHVGGGGTPEIARLLASAGAYVVIADRVHDLAEEVAAGIRADGGVALALDMDIEEEASVCAAFAGIAQAKGGIDILVNSAGMSGHKDIVDTSLDLWDDIQSLNLRANFLCMREAIKHMVAAGNGGRILNLTTTGGLHPMLNGNGVYAAARLGTKALGECVALDHAAHGILVNTLMIGVVSNRCLTHPEVAAELKAGRTMTGPATMQGRLPLGRGEFIDIAAAVLFLVSPASRYITGQSLVLDGGFLLS